MVVVWGRDSNHGLWLLVYPVELWSRCSASRWSASRWSASRWSASRMIRPSVISCNKLQFVADLICIYIYVHVYMYVFVYMFIYIYINPGFLNQCLRARGLGVAEVKDLRDDIVSGDDYIGMGKHCSLAPMGIHSSLHQHMQMCMLVWKIPYVRYRTRVAHDKGRGGDMVRTMVSRDKPIAFQAAINEWCLTDVWYHAINQ